MEPLSSPLVDTVPAPQAGRIGRARRWAGILSAYLSSQVLVQLLGIAAGILFIRHMPVHEFALYTLAASVITFFTFVTDLGSTTSLVHFFHRAVREGADFRCYVAAVLSLRWTAFFAGTVVVLAGFTAAALGKGFDTLPVVLAAAAVLLAVALQIGASVRLLTLRLRDRYGQSYRAELAGAALRLLLALGMVAAALLRSWIGLLAAAAGSALTAWLAREPDGPAAGEPPRTGATDLRAHRRAVLRYLLPTLPSALYFAVQAPLVVWLAATFGASRGIAEVGALTRLGLLVGVFSGLTGVVFMPRLARIAEERTWRLRSMQFGAVHAVLAAGMVLAAWMAPGPLLWILGEQYAGLDRELLLVVAGAGLALLDGYLVALNLARSWTRWQGAAMAGLLVTQVALVALLPMGTTAGVLTFNLLSAACALLGQAAITALGFVRARWVEWDAVPRPAGTS
jgi:O-antigen/teichoic acid export membrane protein